MRSTIGEHSAAGCGKNEGCEFESRRLPLLFEGFYDCFRSVESCTIQEDAPRLAAECSLESIWNPRVHPDVVHPRIEASLLIGLAGIVPGRRH